MKELYSQYLLIFPLSSQISAYSYIQNPGVYDSFSSITSGPVLTSQDVAKTTGVSKRSFRESCWGSVINEPTEFWINTTPTKFKNIFCHRNKFILVVYIWSYTILYYSSSLLLKKQTLVGETRKFHEIWNNVFHACFKHSHICVSLNPTYS